MEHIEQHASYSEPDRTVFISYENSDQVQQDPDDIFLAFHSVQGVSDGEVIHLGMEAFYHRVDQTVYIKHWGPEHQTVEKYPVPDQVPKTKEAILKYLTEKNVFIPV